MMVLTLAEMQCMRAQLADHPLYGAVQQLSDLRCFMEHHVYSVWDFMSLLKHLQGLLAPTGHPWLPSPDPRLRRFVNELVLEEESDCVAGEGGERYLSHFELYLEAMAEVGADCARPRRFIEEVSRVAAEAARSAVRARLALWDGVLGALGGQVQAAPLLDGRVLTP